MSKKSSFRGCFDKQYGKCPQTLLKSSSQRLYHIHSSLASKLCSKKSLLLTCQILGLLVNTLAADEKYPAPNKDNLTIPIQMQLSQKKIFFFNFWVDFWNLDSILNILEQKTTLTAFAFPKLRTLKRWLDKCLKSPVSEDPSRSNMVNVPKHCWNMHHITFIILIGHSQVNWVEKSSSYWHEKSWDCLLTHWLLMKNILFLIETI